jgi:hypothetical protein
MLLITSCATWYSTGSLVRDRCLHVGLRPASDGWGDFAATLQVTTDWPRCPKEKSR